LCTRLAFGPGLQDQTRDLLVHLLDLVVCVKVCRSVRRAVGVGVKVGSVRFVGFVCRTCTKISQSGVFKNSVPHRKKGLLKKCCRDSPCLSCREPPPRCKQLSVAFFLKKESCHGV